MIRDLALQTQAAEPPVSQIKVHLLAQASLRSDAVAVAHDQHTDHDFRINRRSARVAVMGGEVLAEIS